jgi:hypothetical protein
MHGALQARAGTIAGVDGPLHGKDAQSSGGFARMRYMQVIEAGDVHAARRAYLQLLEKSGIALMPSMAIYVETVHRTRATDGSWLCYIAQQMPAAA